MEKSTKKKVIIIASLLVIGGVVAFVIYKAKKNKSGSQDVMTDSPPAGEGSISESSLPTQDTTVPVDVKQQSFADVKKFFGTNAKNFGTYITYTADQSSFGLSLGASGSKIQAKFLSNGGYRLYFIPKGSTTPTLLNGGLYYNGGKKLHVYNGKNKGLIAEGSNPINNLKKTQI